MTDNMSALERELDALMEHLQRSGALAQSLVRGVQAVASSGALLDDRPEVNPAATVATVVTMLGSVMKLADDAIRFADRARSHLTHLDVALGEQP